MNILFSCAGRRHYLLKYFKEVLSQDDKIIATDMQASAPALSEADIVEIVPSVYADDYIAILKNICLKHNVDAIISLNDLELPILSKCIEEFNDIGTTIIVSSSDIIDICFDKFKTSQYIQSIGLISPLTFINIDDAVQAIKDNKLHFPLIIKPRWGSGSIGIEIAYDLDDLFIIYHYIQKKIKHSILANISINTDNILIQEFIIGLEYGIDIMNDLHGNYCGVSIKQKISMRSGETDKAVTINNTELENIGKQIATNLRHIANLDCDILEKNGKYYVLDLNPRFGGGYPFSHEAGVNLPSAIISWLKNDVPSSDVFRYVPQKTFAKCDTIVDVSK